MELLTGWTPRERHAVTAAYLGWALDAFDFFVLVFVLSDVAAEFPCRHSRRGPGADPDLGVPASGRFHIRAPGRPLWPPSRADGQYRLLFAVRLPDGVSRRV